jgi:hypothetical protein
MEERRRRREEKALTSVEHVVVVDTSAGCLELLGG